MKILSECHKRFKIQLLSKHVIYYACATLSPRPTLLTLCSPICATSRHCDDLSIPQRWNAEAQRCRLWLMASFKRSFIPNVCPNGAGYLPTATQCVRINYRPRQPHLTQWVKDSERKWPLSCKLNWMSVSIIVKTKLPWTGVCAE